MQCGPITIRLESTEEHGPALVHRHFKVTSEGDNEERSVTQIHVLVVPKH
jgi:hypothetical protein